VRVEEIDGVDEVAISEPRPRQDSDAPGVPA
jgi:hypothetical protein